VRAPALPGFDPGPGVSVVENKIPGGSGKFLLALDSDGRFLWVRSGGGFSLTVGPEGSVVFIRNVFRFEEDDPGIDLNPTCGQRIVTPEPWVGEYYTTRLFLARAGDFDLDGDVDLLDAARMQNCFTGPSDDPCGPPCASCASGCDAFDVHFDNAIDMADVSSLMPLLTGPNP